MGKALLIVISLLALFLWSFETLTRKIKEHDGSYKFGFPDVLYVKFEEKTGPEVEAAQLKLKRIVLAGKILIVLVLTTLAALIWFS